MDFINELQFRLRNEVLSRLKLRKTLPDPSKIANPKEQQFYSLLLNKFIEKKYAEEFSVVWDVGCRNWSYARALAECFENADLMGVELDGARRYWNLYRRIDVAQAFAAELTLEGRLARCYHEDFLKLPLNISKEEKTAFCFFFPFVSENPCQQWGLPSRFANFGEQLLHIRNEALINHTENTNTPWVFGCHQGEWEAQIARKFYQDLGFEILQEKVITQEEYAGLWPSNYDIFLFTAKLNLF